MDNNIYLYYDKSNGSGANQSYLLTDFQDSNVNNYSIKYNWNINLEPEPEPEPELEPEPEIEPEPIELEPELEPLDYIIFHFLSPLQYFLNNISALSQSTINFLPVKKDGIKSELFSKGYFTYYDKWSTTTTAYKNNEWTNNITNSKNIFNPIVLNHSSIDLSLESSWDYLGKRTIGLDANGNEITTFGDDNYKIIPLPEGFKLVLQTSKLYN